MATIEQVAQVANISAPVLFRCRGCETIEIPQNRLQPDSWINAHICSKICEERYFLSSLKKLGVGHRFIHASFSNFEVLENNRAAYETSLKCAQDLERGAFIHGSVGAGKTHLLVSVVRSMIENRIADPEQMRFIPMLELLEQVKRSWDSGERDPVERLKRIDVLLIDDLGMEIVRDWAFQIFLNIITYRYNNELPTYLSSNLNEVELLERYGSAVMSRIAQMCEIVKLEAGNYRMKAEAA
jgi:DNA replication protein DnaC